LLLWRVSADFTVTPQYCPAHVVTILRLGITLTAEAHRSSAHYVLSDLGTDSSAHGHRESVLEVPGVNIRAFNRSWSPLPLLVNLSVEGAEAFLTLSRKRGL
jgi:hypothetical protein